MATPGFIHGSLTKEWPNDHGSDKLAGRLQVHCLHSGGVALATLEEAVENVQDHFRANWPSEENVEFIVYKSEQPDGTHRAIVEVRRANDGLLSVLAFYKILYMYVHDN